MTLGIIKEKCNSMLQDIANDDKIDNKFKILEYQDLVSLSNSEFQLCINNIRNLQIRYNKTIYGREVQLLLQQYWNGNYLILIE